MAIKEAISIRCDGDGCKTSADIPSKTAVPDEWITVGLGILSGGIFKRETFHLCSVHCVEKWAKARKRVEKIEGTYPCGLCDFISNTVQGLRAHERNAHGYHASKEGING